MIKNLSQGRTPQQFPYNNGNIFVAWYHTAINLYCSVTCKPPRYIRGCYLLLSVPEYCAGRGSTFSSRLDLFE